MIKNNSLIISAIAAATTTLITAIALLFIPKEEFIHAVCVVLLSLSVVVLILSLILLKGIINLELKVKNKIITMNSDGIHIIEYTEIVEVATSGDVTVNTVVDNTDSTKNIDSKVESGTGDITATIEKPIVHKPNVKITTKHVMNSVLVVITSDTKDAKITYKINDKSFVYQNEFSVFENCKITATAKYKNIVSDCVDVIIDSFVVSKPSIIEEDKVVTINCSTSNSDIYYTLDGKEPTQSSILYKGPFAIKKTCTIKAIACRDNYKNSVVCTEDIVVVLTKKDRTRLFTNEKNVIGISYRGNSHIKSDTPCQDCHIFSKINDKWSIAIVSDGAGSAKNSDQGSRAVCAAFKYYIEKLVQENTVLQKGLILDEKSWDIEFKGMIYQFHRDLKDNIVKPNIPFESLAATIILLLYSRDGYMFAHVGDGRAAVRTNGNWKTILTPHKGTEANQTIFCTSQYLGLGEKSRPNLKMSGIYVPETKTVEEQIDGFVLMSDGCENGAWITYQKRNLENGDFIVEDVNLPRKAILDQFINILGQEMSKREEITANFITEHNDAFENEPDDKTILIGLVE